MNLAQTGVLGFGDASLLPTQRESMELIDLPLADGEVDVVLAAENQLIWLYLDGQRIQPEMALTDTDPVAGDMFLWVFLSANHDANCTLENVRIWSLD